MNNTISISKADNAELQEFFKNKQPGDEVTVEVTFSIIDNVTDEVTGTIEKVVELEDGGEDDEEEGEEEDAEDATKNGENDKNGEVEGGRANVGVPDTTGAAVTDVMMKSRKGA